MRRAALWVALWLMAASAAAQAVQVGAWQNGTIDLSGNSTWGWHAHEGDNPAWARPGFDDSAWPEMAPVDAYEHIVGWRWFRLRVHLPEGHAPLALLADGQDGAYEVYVNGQLAAGPRLKPALLITVPKERVINLGVETGDVELALRVFVPSRVFQRQNILAGVQLGTAAAIESERRTSQSARLLGVVPSIAAHLLVLIGGIGALLLYGAQRERREYLWLGTYLILVAVDTVAFELNNFGFAPISVNWFVAIPLLYLATLVEVDFIFSFAGLRMGRAWRVYEALLVAIPFLLPALVWTGRLGYGPYNVVEACAIAPASLILPVLLLVWYVRGNREAGWLIVPTLFMTTTVAIYDIGVVAAYFGWRGAEVLSSPFAFGPVLIFSFDLANLLFLLAIGVVMFFRFTRVSQEQARAAAELDAAREVQQHLVPSVLPATPGCRIETAYLPAAEVGGDFYQVMEQADGSCLIVIGDVSGKGLKAAMTGALAIGALRTLATQDRSQAALLNGLNEQILQAQSGGFITCLCARVDTDGRVTLANAGHLSPYRNGAEVACDAAFPLGLIHGAAYAEHTLQLAPGDQLTFLSDGVVEARDASGELFGFERTLAISGQSAEKIAEAAQRFGQEDDITVLTLTFVPVDVLHA
ncbi:MAG: SpoIIE family protein phosphatase [Silvibacterium sp.]